MPHFLEYVLPSLTKYSSRTFIKLFIGMPEHPAWSSVTYQTCLDDVERVGGHWLEPLQNAGLKQQDVIGIWITGDQYRDIVHLYAISRIGYIPQMLNKAMALTGQAVVKDLLVITKGKAVLYDPFFKDFIKDIPVPCMELPELSSVAPLSMTLPIIPFVRDDEVAMIFHTSGTTSGKPKPVPETHSWLRCQAQTQWPALYQGGREDAVVNNLGSFANVGSATTISYLSWSGHCLVQTSKPDFDDHEFLAMVAGGLNFVLLYAPWLSKLINKARTDKEVLTALRKMNQVSYTGAALNPEDEQWLIENGIAATVIYATTESGDCFISDISNTKSLPAMHIIEGVNCKLIPASGVNKEDMDGDSEKRAGEGKLFDCFIPADAENCPHPSIRNRPDGHITGDLFEETSPGLFAFRTIFSWMDIAPAHSVMEGGRNDDWIRTGKMQSFCDTKSIEDNILVQCADLVHNCVVVGHYKPGIVLLVEPLNVDPTDTGAISALKFKILERHRPFNSRLFIHERLHDEHQIVAVPRGTLPRTMEKGNIRRKATEDQHAEVLEKIWKDEGVVIIMVNEQSRDYSCPEHPCLFISESKRHFESSIRRRCILTRDPRESTSLFSA